ncbi:response regulator [Marivita sp.]|uniref:response regulator n=1 Tax=Marivita sp. TaxID=2003365 RepID=UPI0025BB0458|nr:response regulator [Marivita sp.]
MKILAVDDDFTALEILELALSAAGYDNFDLAQSPGEALAFIAEAETPYDCLLLDIVMPEMDGVALCRHVRQMPLYAHVPIIMITAVQHKDTLTSAIASGATDYVSKPFDGLELVTRLRAAESLMNATKAAHRHARPNPVKARAERASALQLPDAFSLESKPGLVSQADLVCEFMETDQLRRSMHMFSVAVSDVERLWDALTATEFRAFVNELANSIYHVTAAWNPRISYTGHGVFLVALFDVGFISAKGIHSVFKASLATTAFQTVAACRAEIALCVEHVRLSDPDDHLRINALFQAGTIARGNAAHRTTAECETDMRHQILGRDQQCVVTSYEIALMKAAPQKIIPRRISRGQQRASQVSEASADKRDAAVGKQPFLFER